MKLNIDKEQIGGIVKNVCNVAVTCFLLSRMLSKKERNTTVSLRIGEAKYSDAIDAVMNSDMLSSTKTAIVEVMKRDEDSEYYKTVISIVNSDMLGSAKLHAITTLSKE